jgi:signal peptidase II
VTGRGPVMKRLSSSAGLKSAAAIIAMVVAADQFTKNLTVSRLAIGERFSVALGVDFVHSLNDGVAFSRGRGIGGLIIPITLVVVFVSYMALKELRKPGGVLPAVMVGYSLILGGALGNLADRIFRGPSWGKGSVVDMVDVGWWPVFNLADAALSTGVVCVLITSFMTGRKPSTSKTQTTESRPSGDSQQSGATL